MRDALGRLKAEAKPLGRGFRPRLYRLRAWYAAKGIVDLGSGKMPGVKWQHFGGGHFLRIEFAFPFCVLKSGGANPWLHGEKYMESFHARIHQKSPAPA
jgi:hypothetical protein